MKNFFNNDYEEEYARLLLQDYLNKKIIHRTSRYGCDKPDLIDDEKNIGIEITNSEIPENRKRLKILSDIDEKDNRNDKIKINAKKLGVEKCLTFVNGIAVVTHYSLNTKEIIENVLRTINNKNKKSKGYNQYNSNQLYIITSIFASDIDDLALSVQDHLKNNKIFFDTIYLRPNSEDFAIVTKKQYSIEKISLNKLSKYKTDSKIHSSKIQSIK